MRLALAAGLALLATSVALILSGSPIRVLSTNSITIGGAIAVLHDPQTVCQPEHALPHGTTGVRVTLESIIGPRVLVTISSQGRVLARGARGSGWTGADVTVPVDYSGQSVLYPKLCVTVSQHSEPILVLGNGSNFDIAASSNGATLGGRMRVEYLARDPRSWWSLIAPTVRRLGLGRAPSGSLVAWLILALMAAVAALAARLCLRELGRSRAGAARVPRAAWLCALIACLNAAAWSLLSPPFQVPDEPAHFAYVQQLAEAHRLPSQPQGEGASEAFSAEETTALADLRQGSVRFMPSEGTINSPEQQHKLEHDLAQPLSRRGSGYASTATSEPPLYYVLETIPYALASSGSLLDQLELMRLFSSLFAGVTALFAFLFVRETLPRVPWAWTIGGLCTALAPLLAFISGGVNPDGMLFAVSAALFYLVARAFRRGLSPALAGAICAVMLVGVLTKLNFAGLVPGALLGLLITARRASHGSLRVIYRPAAVTFALGAGALLLVLAVGPLSHSASVTFVSALLPGTVNTNNLLSELSYTWQFYLPRLPGTFNYFPGLSTTRQLWFDGLVGLYGWADTEFPGWAYEVALLPAALVALLWLRELVSRRVALRRRGVELVVYTTMSVGLLGLVGLTSYSSDILDSKGPFWEPRYLLPLLPLFAAAIALAARGAGRRLGPAVGAVIVVLVLGHDIFSQLLVVARYYS